MPVQRLLSERNVAGGLLILSALLMFVGVILWTGRNIFRWPLAEEARYLIWERAFIISAIVAALLGLSLLEGLLENGGDSVIARLGLVACLIGGILGIAAEAYEIDRQEFIYSIIVVYVVLFLLGQAAFGVSLLKTGLLPAWIGWATIVWSLGWLIVLPILSPGDIYYPVLHHVAPLLIGIALLVKS